MTTNDTDTQTQLAGLLGVKHESVGKTQARQNFLPLVDGLSQSALAVEITDHDKPVAMLVSYNHWVALVAKLRMLSNKDQFASSRPNLIGSVEVVGDLEEGSQIVADAFSRSIKESAENL